MSFLTNHKRWLIVVLLASFSVVNYLDRQVLSVLAPTLRKELGISTEQYSYIVSTFLTAYGIGYAITGRMIDRIGVKLGLALALGFWSLVGMGHAAVVGWLSLAAARFLLGIGQSANSPGGMKALAEWIPPRERGLCSAIFSNANMLGAVIAPPVVAGLALWLGWRWAFLITGASGFVLLALWWWIYDTPEKHRGISEAERAHILQHRGAAPAAKPDVPVSYLTILRDRACLGLCLIRFFTDPFAYFISFWLLDYFQTVRGFSLQTVALLGWIPYLASPLFGGPLGGAIGDWMVRRGVEPRVARLRMMFAAACITPLALVAVRTELTWLAVAIVTLMVAANSCWSVNKLTLATELVPRSQVASLVSLGGIAGSVGGVVSTLLAGRLIATVGYVPVFTGLGFLHLTAFAILAWAQRGRAGGLIYFFLTNMPATIRCLAILGLGAASFTVCAAAGPVFELPATPIELVTSEEKFRPFAENVRDEVERLLGVPAAVDDPATFKLLLSSRVHLAHHFGDNEKAISTAAWIRSQQTDPTERAFAGLTTLASVTARRKHPGAPPGDADYRGTFAREFARQLADLPRTPAIAAMLRRQHEKISGMTEAALLAETREKITPAIVRRGSCGLDEADQLVRVRHRIVSILPVKAETLQALDAAIAARR